MGSSGSRKGIALGRAEPFTKEMIEKLRSILREEGRLRDLALLCVGVDTCLRSCDVVDLRISDVVLTKQRIRASFTKPQMKTAHPVTCGLSDYAKSALKLYLSDRFGPGWSAETHGDEWLFPGYGNNHLGARSYQRLVQDWTAYLRWAGSPIPEGRVGAHSIRRSKTTYIYDETKDIVACQHLLGHANMWYTDRYLGGSVKKSLAVAAKHKF